MKWKRNGGKREMRTHRSGQGNNMFPIHRNKDLKKILNTINMLLIIAEGQRNNIRPGTQWQHCPSVRHPGPTSMLQKLASSFLIRNRLRNLANDVISYEFQLPPLHNSEDCCQDYSFCIQIACLASFIFISSESRNGAWHMTGIQSIFVGLWGLLALSTHIIQN